jgi:hypothetical protein
VAALFSALAHARGAGRSLPVWSPEHQADLGDFTRRFFSELAREPLTVVLDDCHRVPDDSPLLTLLEQAREVCGDRLRWVLISRRAPPPLLARGRVGGWLDVLDDLRLSPAEALDLARSLRGRELSPAEARALDGADGWLAHVLALTRAHQPGAGPMGGSGAQVGDFLATELLAPEAMRLLQTLSVQRYFVDSTAGGQWRLHDLLRDALRARNAAQDSPDTLNEVRRRLAHWVRDAMPEAAMQLYVAARDTEGALALLDGHGNTWLAKGLHRLVDGWMRALPQPRDVHRRTAHALWQAQALLPLEPEAARPLFAAARQGGCAAGDAMQAYAAWSGEVASYVVQWGAVQGPADLVDVLEALHAELGPPQDELAFRTSADALTALMYGRAEDPRHRGRQWLLHRRRRQRHRGRLDGCRAELGLRATRRIRGRIRLHGRGLRAGQRQPARALHRGGQLVRQQRLRARPDHHDRPNLGQRGLVQFPAGHLSPAVPAGQQPGGGARLGGDRGQRQRRLIHLRRQRRLHRAGRHRLPGHGQPGRRHRGGRDDRADAPDLRLLRRQLWRQHARHPVRRAVLGPDRRHRRPDEQRRRFVAGRQFRQLPDPQPRLGALHHRLRGGAGPGQIVGVSTDGEFFYNSTGGNTLNSWTDISTCTQLGDAPRLVYGNGRYIAVGTVILKSQ